jgi:two-component system, NarL family, captular synthesis response regulator RcsB
LTIRVAVADDHPTLLAGMEHLLSGFDGIEVIGLVTDSTALVDLLGKSACDVVVTDFSMPNGRYGDGLALLKFLQRRFPKLQRVVLTGVESPDVLTSILDIGVRAVLSKADDLHHLESAIRTAHLDQIYLSPTAQRIVATALARVPDASDNRLSKRETEVLRLYAEGLSVSQIGARNGRSSKTISAQKMTAMKKLNLKNDADIFRYARANGLVQSSETSRESAKGSDKES